MAKLILAALLAAALPRPAGALELLLEANRGESGTIGYVDIDRVFKEYSGTTSARDEFVSEIKKKEAEVSARKTAIFTLKAELAKLRQEREFALTLPSLMETRRSMEEALKPAPAAPVEGSTAPPAAVEGSTAAPAGTAVSTQAAAGETAKPLPPDLRGLPGMGEGIEMPGVGKVPIAHFKFSVSTSVPEIDSALARKEEELKKREDDLKVFQRQSERELLEYESRRTEMLLGRIYVALKELATKEEVSVVVDKRNILFGQNAVDLTGKLLEKLEGEGL